MKRINILPLAEKEVDYSLLMAQAGNKSGMTFPLSVYLILFVAMIVFAFINPYVTLIFFGTSFILVGIDNSGTIKHNGRVVENNAWNRLPFLIIGIFLTLFGGCAFISVYNKSIAGFAAKIVCALMIATIASIFIGRLIYLIVLSSAAADRKRSCTCPVPYEPDDYTPDGTTIYKYCYEGECFHFMDHEGSVFTESTGLDNTIMIDPDAPERYYLKSVFGHYGKSLGKLIRQLSILIVLLTSPLLIFLILKYILGLDAHLEYILDIFS